MRERLLRHQHYRSSFRHVSLKRRLLKIKKRHQESLRTMRFSRRRSLGQALKVVLPKGLASNGFPAWMFFDTLIKTCPPTPDAAEVLLYFSSSGASPHTSTSVSLGDAFSPVCSGFLRSSPFQLTDTQVTADALRAQQGIRTLPEEFGCGPSI